MGRYKVVVGEKFDVEAVDVTDVEVLVEAAKAAERLEDGKVRRPLALGIIGAVALALVVAAIVGYMDGTYDEIGAVWGSVAVPLGYIFGTYFTKGSS